MVCVVNLKDFEIRIEDGGKEKNSKLDLDRGGGSKPWFAISSGSDVVVLPSSPPPPTLVVRSLSWPWD